MIGLTWIVLAFSSTADSVHTTSVTITSTPSTAVWLTEIEGHMFISNTQVDPCLKDWREHEHIREIPWPWTSVFRANLSDSYFTNRQDRYVLLENCREVADFFSDLVEAVGDVSLQLQPDDSVTMLEGMVHPYKGKTTKRRRVRVCTRAHGYPHPTPKHVLTLHAQLRRHWAPFSARGADGFR